MMAAAICRLPLTGANDLSASFPFLLLDMFYDATPLLSTAYLYLSFFSPKLLQWVAQRFKLSPLRFDSFVTDKLLRFTEGGVKREVEKLHLPDSTVTLNCAAVLFQWLKASPFIGN